MVSQRIDRGRNAAMARRSAQRNAIPDEGDELRSEQHEPCSTMRLWGIAGRSCRPPTYKDANPGLDDEGGDEHYEREDGANATDHMRREGRCNHGIAEDTAAPD